MLSDECMTAKVRLLSRKIPAIAIRYEVERKGVTAFAKVSERIGDLIQRAIEL